MCLHVCLHVCLCAISTSQSRTSALQAAATVLYEVCLAAIHVHNGVSSLRIDVRSRPGPPTTLPQLVCAVARAASALLRPVSSLATTIAAAALQNIAVPLYDAVFSVLATPRGCQLLEPLGTPADVVAALVGSSGVGEFGALRPALYRGLFKVCGSVRAAAAVEAALGRYGDREVQAFVTSVLARCVCFHWGIRFLSLLSSRCVSSAAP